MDYLCNIRGEAREVAEEVFKFVGGRIKHLQSIATALNQGTDIESTYLLYRIILPELYSPY